MPPEGAKRVVAGTRFRDVRRHDSITSTNAALLDVAREGAPEGVVIVADHQTAGRGRLDRTWVAPPGSSLLLSVLLRPLLPLEYLHLTTSVVGLAAADACADVAGFRPQLKWPNDLVVAPDWPKLAGILAELVLHDGAVAVVVGIGMNVNWPAPLPADLAASATAANLVAGRDVDREALLDRFLVRLEDHYAALQEPGGVAAVADAVRAASATIGRDVRVELPNGPALAGRAVDIGVDGRLLVEDAAGALHQIAVGDVIHLRPA